MADVIQFKLARNTRTGKTQRIPPSIWGNQTRMRTRNWVLVEAPPEDQHTDPVSVNIPSLNGTARPVIEMPEGIDMRFVDQLKLAGAIPKDTGQEMFYVEPSTPSASNNPGEPEETKMPAPTRNPKTRK